VVQADPKEQGVTQAATRTNQYPIQQHPRNAQAQARARPSEVQAARQAGHAPTINVKRSFRGRAEPQPAIKSGSPCSGFGRFATCDSRAVPAAPPVVPRAGPAAGRGERKGDARSSRVAESRRLRCEMNDGTGIVIRLRASRHSREQSAARRSRGRHPVRDRESVRLGLLMSAAARGRAARGWACSGHAGRPATTGPPSVPPPRLSRRAWAWVQCHRQGTPLPGAVQTTRASL